MSKKRFFIAFFIIAILHIGLVLLFGTQKNGFHEDEYYTYWSVSSESIGPSNFTWQTGHDLQNRFLVRDGMEFSYRLVGSNQAKDVHPPLYYMALHTLMSFFSDTFYKWFGILVNLAFSLVTYAALVFSLSVLSKGITRYNKEIALFSGLIYCILPSTISAVMLTRMYAMSTMWTMLYTAVFVLLMRSASFDKKKFALLTAAGAFICYATYLTHYFSMLVPFFLTAAYCIYTLLRRKNILRMLLYGCSMVAAIGLAILTYPVSLQHIFADYRGTDAIGGLLDLSFARTKLFLGYMDQWIFSGTLAVSFIVFVIALVFVFVALSKKNGNYLYSIDAITITCLASFYFLTKVALIVGEASCRYFYPVVALMMPFMAYVICIAVDLYREKLPRAWGYALLASLLLLFVPAACGYAKENVSFLYKEDAQKVAFSMEHHQYPAVMVYDADTKYRAWYVDNQLWPFDWVFFMEYRYIDQLQDERLATADKIVVYMDAPIDLLDKLIQNNPNLSKYTLVRHDPFFYVYLLE